MARRLALLTCMCCCWMGLVGCAEQNKKMDASAMKPMARPVELDLLNAWVGKWESTNEVKMPDGKTMKGTGSSDIAWDLDNRILVERSTENMGEMGTDHAMIVFAYDSQGKNFDTTYYSSMGMVGKAKMRFDQKSKTWIMQGDPSFNPMMGKKTIFSMTMTMPDNNTMQFTWQEHESFMGAKGKKFMEGTGTAKRQG
jgi:hypothetical protein